MESEWLLLPWAVKNWGEVWVAENLDTPFASGDEDGFSAPGEDDLVRLDVLLVVGQWFRLGWIDDVEVVDLKYVSILRSRLNDVVLTLLPTMILVPSGCHANETAEPSPGTSLIHFPARTSQIFNTPSALTLHSSASLTGLKATFSMLALWPLSSVVLRTLGFSGFQTRRVLSTAPVAMRVPVGFQLMHLILSSLLEPRKSFALAILKTSWNDSWSVFLGLAEDK